MKFGRFEEQPMHAIRICLKPRYYNESYFDRPRRPRFGKKITMADSRRESQAIRIPIPPGGTDLTPYFYAIRNGDFKDALDLDVIARSDGATLDEIEINEVTVDADVVAVNYTLSFSAYLGCSDRTWADVESGRVYGMKRGDAWFFERHTPYEPRSTADEL